MIVWEDQQAWQALSSTDWENIQITLLRNKTENMACDSIGKQGATSKPDNPHQMEKFLEIENLSNHEEI